MKVRTATGLLAWLMRRAGFLGWTSFWNVVCALPGHERNERLLRHERCHLEQIERDGRLLLSIRYLYWLARRGYWAQYVWLALRNPANNLQRYRLFRFDADPVRVRYWGDRRVDDVAGLAGWQLVSCGWRAGFYWIMPWSDERCLRVRLGYKIDPSSAAPTSAALSVLINPWANFGR